MLIKVTQAYIDSGERNDCYRCPIALALKEVLKGNVHVIVGNNYCGLYINEEHQCYPEFPRGIATKTVLFDIGKKIEPFEFELAIPEVYLKENDNDKATSLSTSIHC